jgi:hypothetical protein
MFVPKVHDPRTLPLRPKPRSSHYLNAPLSHNTPAGVHAVIRAVQQRGLPLYTTAQLYSRLDVVTAQLAQTLRPPQSGRFHSCKTRLFLIIKYLQQTFVVILASKQTFATNFSRTSKASNRLGILMACKQAFHDIQSIDFMTKTFQQAWRHHGIPRLDILRHPKRSFYDIQSCKQTWHHHSMQTDSWHRKAGKQTF